MAKNRIKCLAFIVIFGCVIALAKPVFAARIHVINKTDIPMTIDFTLRSLLPVIPLVTLDIFGNVDRVWDNYIDSFTGYIALYNAKAKRTYCVQEPFSALRFFATVVVEKDEHAESGVKCTFTFR